MTMKEIKVRVPEGITEFSVQVNGETATVIYDTKCVENKEEWRPKDGYFYSIDNGNVVCSTAIYNGKYKPNFDGLVPFYCGINAGGKLVINIPQKGFGFGHYYEIRPATEEEKQRLFDALAQKGKRWNAQQKRIEDLPRWRADANKHYFFITSHLEVSNETEVFHGSDDARYNACNYFKTEEAAGRVAEQIREIFKNSKAE